MERKSYIGVTGFMDEHQAAVVCRGSNIALRSDNPLLMVGALLSQRSIRGELRKRHPHVDAIPAIFENANGALGIIHYHSRERDPGLLLLELLQAREKGGPHCQGLQLNVFLPPTRALYQYGKKYPGDTLVVQVCDRAFELANNNPHRLAELVAPYVEESLATHILLDRSDGKGKPLAVGEILCVVDAFARRGYTKAGEGVVVAGGRCAENAHILHPLFQEFPYLSVDAEGELHTGDERDRFSVDRAVKWVNAVLKLRARLRGRT